MKPCQPLALLALFAVLLPGCDDDASPATVTAPKARSQGVQAATPAATTAAIAASAPSVAPAPARPVLCAQQLGRPGRDAPQAPLGRAGDKARLPESLPTGESWTWVNLWAAWCVPCKQEMPILRAWQRDFAGERAPLRVAFVSLDDDPRQLDGFLASEPPTGMKATYWLEDGPRRAAWLKEAGFADEPELPAHVLIDPAGKIRCIQQGAIEESDRREVLRILRGERGGRPGQPAKAKDGDPRGDRKGQKP